ncbi:TPA: diguanylate cyclase, partial [Salmonella enterica subsp. enterica serovar Typhimurium var. 5-]|nr:diguanylate cyclase [Salmonella enterica subsp. enterica serovar Typhimurium var. 5-]
KIGVMLIKAAAGLLNQFSSENVIVARIGGDEFVVFVTSTTEKEVNQLVALIKSKIDDYNQKNESMSIELCPLLRTV